jgi:diguanylate cyclase (GGDEF)-like protein
MEYAPAPAADGGASPRQHLLEGVLGAVNLGAIVLDDAGRIVLWNAWMARHTGLEPSAALGQPLFTLYPELQGKRVEAAVTQALRNNFPSLLSHSLNKSPLPLFSHPADAARGERMQQAVAITPVALAGGGRHCLIQITDVSLAVGRETLLRQQALVLRSQSVTDGLTGIANRRLFDVTLEKEVRRAKRNGSALSLLMIDIDYFKPYNDHYGHQQGDACLIAVGTAMAAMLKRPGDLLARYGGEEFSAVLAETDADQALRLAEAMRETIRALAIAHDAAPADASRYITVSIGVATQRTPQPVDQQALIGQADRALYLSKHTGRNRSSAYPAVPAVPGAPLRDA